MTLLTWAAILAATAINVYLLATQPSDFPKWWEPKPPRERCYGAQSNLRGTKVGRCACGTHRGEPWR